MKTRTRIGLGASVGFLLLLSLISLFSGSTDIPFRDLCAALMRQYGEDNTFAFIVWQSRLPQLCTAAVAGASLGAAGLAMQTVFGNPLADPSILGVNAGAGLGVAVALLLCGGSLVAGEFALSGFLLTVFSALLGAGVVILLLLGCSALLNNHLLLLIAGVMVSSLVTAAISILSFYATDYGVRSFVFWGYGSFSDVTLDRLPYFAVAAGVGLVGMLVLAKPLNALLLGNNYAANLGIGIKTTRTLLLLLTGWLSATVTALCGPIAFIGLAVPHAARFLLRSSDHRCLLPTTMLLGADLALLCNILAHLPGNRGYLPINALTPLFGAPIVLYLLLKRKKE